MTVVNPKSISGINSITMASGSDNLLTIHTTNTTERLRINSSGDVIVGSGITVSPDGDIFFTGIATGNGSGLTALNASNLGSGTVPTARLGSGTASSSTFLRGDSTFQTITTDLVGDTTPQLGGNLDSNGNNIKLGDSSSSNDDRLQLGAATNGDLEIFHDGSSSYMDNATGDLYMRNSSGQILIRANTDAYISNYAANEHRAAFKNNGAVELYYDGTKKIETTSGGVSVAGKADTDTLTIGSDTLVTNTLAQLNVSHAASSASTYPAILQNASESAASAKGLLIKYTGSSGNWSANQGGDYLRCTADGEGYVNAYISGAGIGQFRSGVRFGTDSSADNLLDDYEEGTWTPAISGVTYSDTQGTYIKIGRSCFVTLTLNGANTSKGNTDVRITGLPFTPKVAGGEYYPANSIPLFEVSNVSLASGYNNMYLRIDDSQGNLQILVTSGQSHGILTAGGGTTLNSGHNLRTSFTYETGS